MASFVYTSFKRQLFGGVHDLDTHDIKLALFTNSFVSDHSTHDEFRDLTGQVATAGNYTSGGRSLSGAAITSAGSDKAVFDADDITWYGSTITARYGVLYNHSIPGDPLICAIDFGSDQSSSNGNFTIQWSTSGIFRLDDLIS